VALGLVLAVFGALFWSVAGTGVEPEPAGVEARARTSAMAGTPGDGAPGPVEAALPPSPQPAGSSAPAPVLPPGVPTGSAGPLLSTPTATVAPVLPPSAAPAEPPPTTTPPVEATPASETTAGPCADGDLRVTARTDATSYPAGQKPVLSLVVTNTGTAPCVRDLDAARQAVAVVRQPGDGLWGSNDCSPGDTDDVRTLQPGEEAVFSVRWSRRTSTPGCAGERTAVPPGTYQLLARLDGIVSEPVPFTLAG
jgi:hypothetical protein